MISKGIGAVVLATVLAACAAVPEKTTAPPASPGTSAVSVDPFPDPVHAPATAPFVTTEPTTAPAPGADAPSGAVPGDIEGSGGPAVAGHESGPLSDPAFGMAADPATPAARSLTDSETLTGLRSKAHGDGIITDLVGELGAEQSDLWARIRKGFAIPDIDDDYVRKWEAWYLERPDYVGRIIDRSRRYLYHVVVEVEQRGMPLEIALLPMIESAFNPMAYSRSKASGIWQFIPSTGEDFGLRQTWWSDSRRDVLAATDGALDYLQKLYGRFGDWQLALAAYNWGEGSIGRAQTLNRRRGLGEDYASLKMPDETRNYLPKLQAVKNIVRNPAAFGLVLGDIPNFPYFKVVSVDRKIDVQRAAEFAGMSTDDFLSLNPQHNRPVIAGADEHTILLPYDRADQFVARLKLQDQPLVSWQAYRVKARESIRQIADRFDLSVQSLRAVNGIGPRSRVPVGHTLLVPVQRPSFEAAATLQHAVFRAVPPSPTIVHRVRRGETLQSVAATYGVSVGELQAWNRLDGNRLKAGQRLRIAGDAGAGLVHVNNPGPRERAAPARVPAGARRVGGVRAIASGTAKSPRSMASSSRGRAARGQSELVGREAIPAGAARGSAVRAPGPGSGGAPRAASGSRPAPVVRKGPASPAERTSRPTNGSDART